MRRYLLIAGLLIAQPVLAQDVVNIPAGEIVEEPTPEPEKPKEKPAKEPAAAPAPAAPETPAESNLVVLQLLNKVTGRVSAVEMALGSLSGIGNFEIVARRCVKSAPDERPENAALLEIREVKPGEAANLLFLGWMFSSSPGLSSLEHPVYDITVLSCESRLDPENLDAPKK